MKDFSGQLEPDLLSPPKKQTKTTNKKPQRNKQIQQQKWNRSLAADRNYNLMAFVGKS